ncbi:LysR substrate-binding domain-containing protein, partial [Segnochrobactraceae bacterium EtOH-i3]
MVSLTTEERKCDDRSSRALSRAGSSTGCRIGSAIFIAGVALHITEGTAREAQMQVREDRLDIAFIACPHEIPDLHSRMFWRDRLMAVMPEAHPLAQRDHIIWQDLAAETFLVREGGAGPQVDDLIVVRAAGKWPVPTILRCAVWPVPCWPWSRRDRAFPCLLQRTLNSRHPASSFAKSRT